MQHVEVSFVSPLRDFTGTLHTGKWLFSFYQILSSPAILSIQMYISSLVFVDYLGTFERLNDQIPQTGISFTQEYGACAFIVFPKSDKFFCWATSIIQSGFIFMINGS